MDYCWGSAESICEIRSAVVIFVRFGIGKKFLPLPLWSALSNGVDVNMIARIWISSSISNRSAGVRVLNYELLKACR